MPFVFSPSLSPGCYAVHHGFLLLLAALQHARALWLPEFCIFLNSVGKILIFCVFMKKQFNIIFHFIFICCYLFSYNCCALFFLLCFGSWVDFFKIILALPHCLHFCSQQNLKYLIHVNWAPASRFWDSDIADTN